MKPCILQPHPVSSAAVEKGVPLEVKVRSQIQTVCKSIGVSDENLHHVPEAGA